MTRLMPVVFCVLTCALLAVPAVADDPPKKLTAQERKNLEAEFKDHETAGFRYMAAERWDDADKALPGKQRTAGFEHEMPVDETAEAHAVDACEQLPALHIHASLVVPQRPVPGLAPVIAEEKQRFFGAKVHAFVGGDDLPDSAHITVVAAASANRW